MSELRLGVRELGMVLFSRVKEAGLSLRPDLRWDNLQIPCPPSSLVPHLNVNASSDHYCEEHRLVQVSLVLVVDLLVPEIVNDEECGNLRMWQSHEPFEPYWLTNVTVIHDWVSYPDEPYRSLNVIEAACLFAQHPYLGSVQCHEEPRRWGHGSIQIYRLPERSRRIIASKYDIPSYNHHAAFTTGALGLGSPSVHPMRVKTKDIETPAEGQSSPVSGGDASILH